MSISGWIAVDLDATLAEYRGWNDGKIGKIIPLMKARIEKWLADGVEVRIFTARVGTTGEVSSVGTLDNNDFAQEQIKLIKDWLEENGLPRLRVTATKDFAMAELWDDRAIQVIPNTGERADGKP